MLHTILRGDIGRICYILFSEEILEGYATYYSQRRYWKDMLHTITCTFDLTDHSSLREDH